jgi:hypothetical protein
VWSQALDVQPNLRITCGAQPLTGTAPAPGALTQLMGSLFAPFGFFTPNDGVLSNLHFSHAVFSILSDSDHLTFASVDQLARAISDLESVHLALLQVDSEEFAIWCGLNTTESREQLLALVSEIERALLRVRTVKIRLSFDEYRPSPKALFASLSQLALVGIGCERNQLQKAWPTTGRKPLSNKWKSRYESIKVFKDLGTLIQHDPSTFDFVVKWKGVGNLDLAIGLMRNHLLIELGGVRHYLPLPAACSRMEAGSVTLSKNKFSVSFVVNESEWPRS